MQLMLMVTLVKHKIGKSEHLYSALHGIQTTLKHSGMDHTEIVQYCETVLVCVSSYYCVE